MLVFRIECDKCPDHHGPMKYCPNNLEENRINYGGRLECPQSDWTLRNMFIWEYCGTTRSQFPRWWGWTWSLTDSSIDENLRPGWRIAVYSVKSARVGCNQVLFVRDKAKLLKTYNYIPSFLQAANVK